ncbi:YdeI/OmpD-associated family protein [Actinoplanes sp. NPDC026623]|uniref:YdeI/OmpD-associated family protein n=1 Tax=Actinoplanes sp. NPDC026623 TaxID=3155610 RepID=UPI0033C58E62
MRFKAIAQDAGRGRVLIPVPFDPNEVWGAKPRHHAGGTANGHRVRGLIERHDQVWGLLLGAMWTRDCAVAAGDEVDLEIEAEGPQRADLADDIAAALAANPEAAEFFDGLAQFYRRAYLRWIDATKRDPAQRELRIAQTVDLLAAGVKDHRQRQPPAQPAATD